MNDRVYWCSATMTTLSRQTRTAEQARWLPLAAGVRLTGAWLQLLTMPSEAIRLSKTASYISVSVQEPGIHGLARTNLRFS